jgi:subtilase family serine protease
MTASNLEIRMKQPSRARSAVRAAAIAAAVVPGVLAMAGIAAAAPPGRHAAAGQQATAAAHGFIKPPCASARPGHMRCFLLYRPQAAADRAKPAGLPAQPTGLTPADLRSAYKLPQATSHQTVAVSIAFHTPGLASFLAAYRKQFGLPPCTKASGCFKQVNQQGNAAPAEPSAVGTGWDLEATLDVSMISAACPDCKILVVEAKNTDVASLGTTDVTAARLGARVISNSYGTFESAAQRRLGKYWNLRGHTVVASSGEFGFAKAQFPADLARVTAVGGTALTRAAGSRRGWREKAWEGSGSGCSTRIAKPAWQHDPRCQGRTVADIAAVATNVPVFSVTYGGWVTVDGTSISAPLAAGIYGLAGNGATATTARLYQHARSFFDITKGNNALVNGFSPSQDCGSTYICVAKKGYDGPTGLGTPHGISGF